MPKMETSINSLQYKNNTEVILSIGSNMGDRLKLLTSSLKELIKNGIQVHGQSKLYETLPMHITEQPKFLNAAILCSTKLDEIKLLNTLKKIEEELGRHKKEIRYGPRPIDLDIIFYGDKEIKNDILKIPHSNWRDRDFVKVPLLDLYNLYAYLNTNCENKVINKLKQIENVDINTEGIEQVYPLTQSKLITKNKRTLIMGILNLTPDSFSGDGLSSTDDTTDLALFKKIENFIEHKCDILDIGGQSTRPGSDRIDPEIELNRVIPKLKLIKEKFKDDLPVISIDTFNSNIALEAVKEGASIINDVSSGVFDKEMIKTVNELSVPYIMMHMRGDPKTMTKLTFYNNLIEDIKNELGQRVLNAIQEGIPIWNIIIDPGIGFAKESHQNLDIIENINNLRKDGILKDLPILIGVSRKRFIEDIIGKEIEKKDVGTCVICAECVRHGADILRVHNVEMANSAVKVADFLYRK